MRLNLLPMQSKLSPRLLAFANFLRTPTLGRAVVGILGLAIVLLLTVNFATFVMIQRTARFNDQVEHSQQVRRASRSVMISLLDAETGQRGFLLSSRAEFLRPYTRAMAVAPDLDALINGDQMEVQVEHRLPSRRLIVLHQPHTVRAGRRFHRPGQPRQLRRDFDQRVRIGIEQIA